MDQTEVWTIEKHFYQVKELLLFYFGGHAHVNIVRARFRKAVTKMAATAGSGKPTSATVQTAALRPFCLW